MNLEQLIAAIRATGKAESIAALEALGDAPSVEAVTRILEAAAAPAPADPATQTAKAAKKKSGKLPVRVGGNVTTSAGKGKVTAVDGDTVTVTLASGKTETLSVSALRAHMAVKGNKKKHQVPAQEADVLSNEDSWDDIANDVRDAVRAKFGYGNSMYPGPYCYTVAVFDDYVIVSADDDFFRVSWSQDAADVVTLGDLEPVELQYVTTAGGVLEGCVLGPLDDDGQFLEADSKPIGNKWSVLLIQEGMSKNRNFYPATVLREAVSLYENRPIYVHHAETPSRFGRSPNEAIGFVKDVKAATIGGTQEAEGGKTALIGTAVILDTDWRRKMVEAWDEGNPNFVGLSHDVDVTGRLVVGGADGPYKRAEKIEKVKSVDLVMNPAAGGRLMQMVAANAFTESDLKEMQMLQKMIEAIKASKKPGLIAALEALGANATEDAVMALYGQIGMQEAVQQPPVAAVAAAQPAAGATQMTEAEVTELRGLVAEGKKRTAMLLIESTVNGSALPAPIKDRTKKRLMVMVEAGQAPTEAQIVQDVKDEVEAYGKIFDGQVVVPGRGVPRFSVTKSTAENFSEACDEFFGVKTTRAADGAETYKLVPNARQTSLRNLYIQFTGDERVTGELKEATRLTESLSSSSFSNVLGDSITRRMVAEYQLPEFQAWRGLIGQVVPLNDFRTQHRMRFGGYGNFPTVAQGAPYTAMTSPTDEEATYTPSKRGGTESITLEMIKNDDVGVVKRIPVRLGRAAGQTLYEFVFDFLRTNPNVYDAVALAAAGHGNNISTTALSATQVQNGRLVMRQQTDMSNGKRLGLKARYLWVPSDLEDLAFQICGADKAVPDASLAAQAAPAADNPVKRAGITPMTVDYWADVNNYWVTASVDQCPMIEVGFLDGREDPELFVQDQPNVGSLFSNDAITWKVRHIYGGVIEDFRGFFGGIVP